MAGNLHPLETVVLERLNNWPPKLSRPVRIGEHDQTAFALGLMSDYAASTVLILSVAAHTFCHHGGIRIVAIRIQSNPRPSSTSRAAARAGFAAD
jgi:Protein of unknown function (DUF2891)